MTIRLLVVYHGDAPRPLVGVLHGAGIAAVAALFYGVVRFLGAPPVVQFLAAPVAIWLAGNLIRKFSREATVSFDDRGMTIARSSSRRVYNYAQVETCSLSGQGVLDLILVNGGRIALEPIPFVGAAKRRATIERVTQELKSRLENERMGRSLANPTG